MLESQLQYIIILILFKESHVRGKKNPAFLLHYLLPKNQKIHTQIKKEKRKSNQGLLFGSCNRVPNPMPPRRKNHKQETANQPDGQRRRIQNLLNLPTRRREEAAQHALIPHRHRRKHQHGRPPVHPVDQRRPVFFQIRIRTRRGPGIEQPQPFEGGEAVVDLAVGWGAEAVGKGGEEAGEGEEAEEGGGHGAGGGVARAAAGEGRGEELEGEEGACREEVGQVGGAG